MRLLVMSDDADYSVECMTRARTTVLRGVMRLEHDVTLERVFSAVSADLDATGTDPYTIDVSEVVFMNSSAIRALAGLVMSAKRARRRMVIVGRQSVPWQDRTLRSLAALYDAVEIRLVTPSATPTLRRELELWAIETSEGKTLRFKDSKGLAYLDRLLSNPGRELHVLEIIGVETAGDAGPVLDERAKAQYKGRLADLREDLVESEQFHDSARATRVREEIDAIAGQLTGAIGLGGRDRRAASDAEKARVNVQRCLKETLERIANADPALGRYLTATVKTGTHCSFKPL
jgi:hypothetical protein